MCSIALGVMFTFGTPVSAQQQAGSIRGVAYDKDFDTPLGGVEVLAVETGQAVTTSEQGNFVFSHVPPGTYTLVFSKEGYVRQVRADVVVSAGQLTDVDVWLPGEFTEMDEFVVQDLQLESGSEAALLALRFESPALMDSIGADLISRAGASDAAGALRLVSGATVQSGKFAVIRGLPDRYVNSQMNSVRLPTADEDTRAVELDQFPAAVIESIQVSKTFTPDQQGDASGGAVNVRLKGIPDETILQFKHQVSYNTEVTGRSDYLTYQGGGVNLWGIDDGDRDIQFENFGRNWEGAVGVSRGDAPVDYKWSAAAGGKGELDSGVKIGGFTSFFYERDSSFFDNGIDDNYWVINPGDPLTPQFNQGAPDPLGLGDYNTALFDVTQGSESVKWGGLASLGIETENHLVGLTYLYTRHAEDTATLAEDTRGKAFFFPGYDPNDPNHPGNQNIRSAPYLRNETLEYAERTTGTLQLNGRHKLPFGGFGALRNPELDWTLSHSSADLNQPDKRQFGATFLPLQPGLWVPLKPLANFTLGNLQRIWKEIEEESDQYSLNLRFPFEQWSGDEGYLKFGIFDDQVERTFDQDTFSNFADVGAQFEGDFDDFWSAIFPFENHPISEAFVDVDYKGDQEISAWYGMLDLPLGSPLNVIAGARFESTEIGIVNDPEMDALWFPPGATAEESLDPGEADVEFQQDDVLPAIGLVWEPLEKVTLRGFYSETVARQTFKELTPVLQQEFLGGPIFIGNPALQMSALKNYDLRVDYTPYEGGLMSISWFNKDIEDAIEYVQRNFGFTFTTPVNYPTGELSGYELELRQALGRFWLDGLSLGANATVIDSEVTLPDDEIAEFASEAFPITSRDMTQAPEYLYNLYLTYDLEDTGTQFAAFYTVQGDTLVAGAGLSIDKFVPDVYAKEFGTLNLSVSQKIGEHVQLQFQAKNLTDPTIEEVYRSDFTAGDQTKTSFTRGREFSIGLSISL